MQFDDVIVTWRDSFSLLSWKDLRLLLLASLNNFRRALKLTIKYFWWLWVLWLIFLILPATCNVFWSPHQLFDAIIQEKVPSAIQPFRVYDIPGFFYVFVALSFIFSVIDSLIHFTYYLSTRSSLEAKNISYYFNYVPKIVPFLIVQVIMALCIAPISFLPFFFTTNSDTAGLVNTIIAFFFYTLPIFAGYIVLDHEKKMIFRALKKSLVLFVHFFPLLCTFSFIFMALLLSSYGISVALMNITTIPTVIVGIAFSLFFMQSLILNLLFLSCCATLYLKIKHTHPNLFFA